MMVKKHQIKYKEETIPYQLVRGKIKNMYIHIKNRRSNCKSTK